MIGIGAQTLIVIFLMITALMIKIFFRIRTSQKHKPKIKNTISFKRLNLFYSLGLISAAIIQGLAMMNLPRDTYILHYTVSIVSNSILISLLVMDEEAVKFLRHKFKLMKEHYHVDEKLFKFKFLNCKVGPMTGLDVERGQDIPVGEVGD